MFRTFIENYAVNNNLYPERSLIDTNEKNKAYYLTLSVKNDSVM